MYVNLSYASVPDTDMCVFRGGGLVSNIDMATNAPTLRWMSYEAIAAGIYMKFPKGRWTTDTNASIHESLTGLWRLLEYFPIVPKSRRRGKGIKNR